MAVTKKPDLSDPVLRAKMAKGMGHNYYGEPAWPNDLLYIFPLPPPFRDFIFIPLFEECTFESLGIVTSPKPDPENVLSSI